MPATTVYLLLGSNLGDRERNLGAARDRLAHIPGIELIDASAIYISEADGMEGENPAFLNQVVKAEYAYRAQELLDELEKIERLLGRTDKGGKLPRPIDLDILLFGDAVIATDRLTVPHRELLHRGFVMIPLLQIDPELVHPVTREPIAASVTDDHRNQVLLYKEYAARFI